MGDVILRDILIIFLVSVPVVLIAHRLRFPSIVGFLITGAIIGPHELGLIADVQEIQLLAEVGVALLLFSIGLEFSFDRLKGWGKTAAGMGALQVLITAAVGAAFAMAVGWSMLEGVYAGCAIALSSTAIVMAILSQNRWFDAPAGRIAIGILIFQDLAVIPMMVILQLMSGEGAGNPLFSLGWALINLLGIAAAIFVISKWMLSPLLHHISASQSKELFVVVVVGLAIGAAYTTQHLGLSFALGAFLAGIMVSATQFRFHALSEIAPFRYCFNGIFFVSLGMIVDPVFVINNIGTISLIVLFIVLAKILISAGTIALFGYPLATATVGALMLAQVGEFSFLLAFFGHSAGALGERQYSLIVDAAAITMVIAPFIVAAAPGLGERLSFGGWRLKLFRRRADDSALIAKELDLEGHAIICGFGPLGKTIGDLLEKRGVHYVVLELNPVTSEKLRKEGRHTFVGDGASAVLLHESGIDRARLLAIAVPDHVNALAILSKARSMNPSLFIAVRSRYRDQVQNFYDAGADVVVCEELEAGIEMGRYVLQSLGLEEQEVKSVIEDIRAFGSADFF